jgi:hypothetical protein
MRRGVRRWCAHEPSAAPDPPLAPWAYTLAGPRPSLMGSVLKDTSEEVVMEAHEELGPVDIVVIAYPAGSPMTGEAVPILLDLVDRGIVRVLDAMFVVKEQDGTYSGFEATDLDDKGLGDFAAFEGASSGLLGDEDVATAADGIEPGSAAAILVYENRWAAPFAAAVRRNGGVLVDFQRVPVQDLIASLEAAEAAA